MSRKKRICKDVWLNRTPRRCQLFKPRHNTNHNAVAWPDIEKGTSKPRDCLVGACGGLQVSGRVIQGRFKSIQEGQSCTTWIPISIRLVHFVVIYLLWTAVASSFKWLSFQDEEIAMLRQAIQRLQDGRDWETTGLGYIGHVVAAAFECMKSMLKMNGVAQPCCSVRSCKATEPAQKSVVMCSHFLRCMWKFSWVWHFADHSFQIPANKLCS